MVMGKCSFVELVMRPEPVSRRGVAPRYQRIEAEDATKLSAHRDRIAAQARAQSARFFLDLRQHLRLARVAIADRVGTSATVIEALEAGDMARLPRWPETVRIVQSYLQIVQLDPRPVLHALHEAHSHHLKLQENLGFFGRLGQAWQSGTLAERIEKSFAAVKSRTLRWTTAASLPVALIGWLMLASVPQASIIPGPLAAMFGLKPVQSVLVSRRDGFTWIEATDPRTRRGDKLQQARR